ncbi:MAG: hypothetical protein GWP15_04070, partial [Nitrospirae bacterium]|nr:hypothetical protein [Nitrospirota bacterium]
MEKEEHLLKVTENPQEQLIMLWMMNFIYDKAKEVVENFKILKQETEEIEKILVAFEPGKDNLPEQVEGLRPAHQALIKALENSLGKQIPEELCSIPEELRDFDDLVERITQALKGNNVEALTASTAVDIILGETYIDDLAIRFRSYIKELVLDIIDENGAEFLDENAEAGLFDL